MGTAAQAEQFEERSSYGENYNLRLLFPEFLLLS